MRNLIQSFSQSVKLINVSLAGFIHGLLLQTVSRKKVQNGIHACAGE